MTPSGRSPAAWSSPAKTLATALIREVREEIGLHVYGPPVVAALIWLRTLEGFPDWATFVCEPKSWDGELNVHDPDGVTLRASFLPVEEATKLLGELHWGSESIVQRLRGATLGSVWTYRWNGEGPWDGKRASRVDRTVGVGSGQPVGLGLRFFVQEVVEGRLH